MTSKYISRLHFAQTACFALFFMWAGASLFGQDYRIGEDGTFYQILRWGRTSASSYEVEIEKRTEGTGREWLPETRVRKDASAQEGEDESLEVSLPSGRYRFRIVSFNALGREAAVSDWTPFRILPAKQPAAEAPAAVEAVKGSETFTLHLKGADLIEGAEAVLVPRGKNSVPVKMISASFSESDDAMDAAFATADVPSGVYDLVVTNPGGLAQTISGIRVKQIKAPKTGETKGLKRDLNVQAGWSYLPYNGPLEHASEAWWFDGGNYSELVSEIGYGTFYYPAGFYLRTSWLPFEFRRSSLGFELSLSAHYLGSKDRESIWGVATISGWEALVDIAALWQIWLHQRTLAVNLRAGIGFGGTPGKIAFAYSDVPGKFSLDYGSTNIVLGAALEKSFWKNLFFEFGVDYIQPVLPFFADDYPDWWFSRAPWPGTVRVSLGAGWRFGPAR